MKNFYEMSKEEYDAAKEIRGFANGKICQGLVLIPTDRVHESGFRIIDVVIIDRSGLPIGKISQNIDTLIFNLFNLGNTLDVGALPLSIDCLPCGYFRIFSIAGDIKIEFVSGSFIYRLVPRGRGVE